jgi:NitT/TauT family transport system permease protein
VATDIARTAPQSDASPASGNQGFSSDVRPEPFFQRHYDVILGLGSVVGFLLFWQWVGTSGIVNPLFTSSPSAIWTALVDLYADGDLVEHLAVSTEEFVYGYALSIGVGIPLGIAIGWYRTANALVNPYILPLYAMPTSALMPLLLIWLGIGLNVKIAVVFLSAFIPIVVSMQHAMRALDTDLLKAARSFGASQWFVFRTIAMPSSVPFMISGLRLALGAAITGVFVGELFASNAGIGYLIIISGATFRVDRLFVGVAVMIVAALVLNAGLHILEQRFSSWRPKH